MPVHIQTKISVYTVHIFERERNRYGTIVVLARVADRKILGTNTPTREADREAHHPMKIKKDVRLPRAASEVTD